MKKPKIELLQANKISATSMLVNVPIFSEDAAKSFKKLLGFSFANRIGLHFNLTEGRPLSPDTVSLVDNNGYFLGKAGFWNSHKLFNSDEIRKELITQIEKFKTLLGFFPSHVGKIIFHTLKPLQILIRWAPAYPCFKICDANLPISIDPIWNKTISCSI